MSSPSPVSASLSRPRTPRRPHPPGTRRRCSGRTGRILFARPGAGARNRPYTKIANDGEQRIHFAITDGHPRSEPTNSIYYFAWEDGAFRRADGSRLASLDELPIDPGTTGTVCLRGFRYFAGEHELFPPGVPYGWRRELER